MENSRRREKAALAIFLALVALGGLLLGGYFLTGRTWSVAATMVDDAAGSLDAYTVIAFNGVVPPGEGDAPHSGDGANGAGRELAPEFTMEDAFGSSSGTGADAGIRDSIQSIFEREDRRAGAIGDDVYVSDVRDIYMLKGAKGLTLNLADPARYADPVVLNAGGKKVGVFSVSAYASRAKLKAVTSLLRDEGADAVLCIVPRTQLLATYDGLDVVLLTAPRSGTPDERDQGNTMVAESPEEGEVGVVLLSSNNVPSFKVVKEL